MNGFELILVMHIDGDESNIFEAKLNAQVAVKKKEIAKKINTFLEQNKIAIEPLAKQVGLSKTIIYKIKKGEEGYTIESLLRLLIVLEIKDLTLA